MRHVFVRLARVALFAALVYVVSLATVYLPNVTISFYVVFLAGFLWRYTSGALVGGIGTAIWSVFNPLGPAPIPTTIAQIVAMAGVGLLGAAFGSFMNCPNTSWRDRLLFLLAGILSTIVYFLPINAVDAWLYQPFWPRFIAGLAWNVPSLVTNAIIFPLLLNVTRHLYLLEQRRS